MLYARFPRCSLYTIVDVPVLLKPGHNVHSSIAHFLVGEYELSLIGSVINDQFLAYLYSKI